jgi:PAT family beta-lactamase induction signal transducer AmpG
MLRAVGDSGSRPAGIRHSIREVAGSWRLLSVALLSFSSGFPLGHVWFAIPVWMKQAGVDIRVVGLFTLAQAPWSFKFLWAPLMDRYVPPFLGRKRGWILLSQIALVALGLALGLVSGNPADALLAIGVLTLLIAFASATHDIAYDAYTVEVLRKEEHGMAVGARVAFYRGAMLVSGGVAISLAGIVSWPVVNSIIALCYLPMMWVTWRAPDPELAPPPPTTLRQAVWEPFVGLLSQHRALEILAFVVLYKLSDNLTQSLTGPFLVEVGFGPTDVGIARTTIGQAASIAGTFVGAVLTPVMGLGRALWVFGILQIVSNLGYAAVAQVGPSRPLMYAAQGFEHLTTGLGSGAFGVLLLRLTQKRFSATQFAVLSSLFTIPRVLAGPPAGILADAIGWRDFFVLTIVTGIPGMVMLARFVPWGVREPEFHIASVARGAPLGRGALAARAVAAGVAAWLAAFLTMGLLAAIAAKRGGAAFELAPQLRSLLLPQTIGDWLTSAGVAVAALLAALATAATLAARRGVVPSPAGSTAVAD